MTDLISLLFIAMIPIDFKITNFSLHLYSLYFVLTVSAQWVDSFRVLTVCVSIMCNNKCFVIRLVLSAWSIIQSVMLLIFLTRSIQADWKKGSHLILKTLWLLQNILMHYCTFQQFGKFAILHISTPVRIFVIVCLAAWLCVAVNICNIKELHAQLHSIENKKILVTTTKGNMPLLLRI